MSVCVEKGLLPIDGLMSGSVNLRHVEVIGNILVFDKNSFNGESSDVLWKQIVALPSVVNSEMKPVVPLIPLFDKFLSSYNCQRIAIHEEIDCGNLYLVHFMCRTQKAKSFKNHLFIARSRGWLGDLTTGLFSPIFSHLEWCFVFMAI